MITDKTLLPDNAAVFGVSQGEESQRLAALRQLNLLDTPHEERFDRIVRTTARLFNVPQSAIKLIDANREWTKASTSGHQGSASRQFSFCNFTVTDRRTLIIPDTLADSRFVNNPYVVESPHVRFYAGRPLAAADGTFIGTLCIMDYQPRTFSADDVQTLDDLATWAENEVNTFVLHQALNELRDISDALEQSRDQALEATRCKSEFLATMSHEIRVPMSAVLGMTEMLLATPPALTDAQRDMLHLIQHSGNLLVRLVNDIMDFSKSEANKLTLETIDFDPVSVVKEIANLLTVRAQRKNLTLKVNIDPDLPRSVQGDPTRLRQVLLNLADNALKFTQQGTVTLSASLEKSSGDRATLCFGVKDSGIGLSKTAQQRLFQPYSQADSATSRKYGGTGLGLAISKRLIELMDGTIELESEEGVGSTFWVRLTVNCSPTSALPIPTLEPLTAARILLVEDNPINRQVALLQLHKLGYAVDCAVNGVEALTALRRKPYDLVLMDCQMPEMDGFATAAAIREAFVAVNGRRIAIVAMTGTALTAGSDRYRSSGMDDHLLKPVKLAVLKQVLERWLPAMEKQVESPATYFAERAKVDTTAVAAMRELVGDDPAALSYLTQSFIADADTLLQKLWFAVTSRQETEIIYRLAHTLKSSSAVSGATGMLAICTHIEEVTEHSDLPNAIEWVAALETEFRRFKAALPTQ